MPYVLARRLPRRPGERREPLSLPRVPPFFAAAAEGRGLELGCAVELCLERALVVRDLDALERPVYPQLLARAATTQVARALPPAKARYLQMLIAALECREAGPDEPGETDTVVDVPLRLFPRVLEVVNDAALGETELAEAVRLEVAAVSDGRTMSEWAALTALRLSL